MPKLPQQRPASRMLPFLLACAVIPCLAAAQAAEKVVLKVKGEAGKSSRYSSQAEFSVDFQGENLKLQSSETSETKVVKVNSDGSVEFDLTVLTQKMKVNGEELPDDEEDKKDENGSIYTLSSRGIMTATKDKGKEDDDKEGEKLNNRLSQATSMVFAAEAVGAGSEWSHKFAAKADWGTLEAAATYKLTAFETVQGAKAAKIEYSYAEADAKGIKGSGIHWVELDSGDVIKTEGKFERVPFDFGADEEITATLTMSGSRTSGSFVGTGQPEPKPSDTKPDAAKAEEKKEEDKNSIDVKTKGWEKSEGIFTLYRKVDETRTRYHLEIKKSQFGKLYMLQTTASAGDSRRVVPGDPINDLVFAFEEGPNNKIFLKTPNYSWRAPGSPEMSKVLERSFSDSYIETFDVEGRQKDRDSVLIDISSFFLGNIGQVSEKVQGGGSLAALLGGGGGSFSPDREKSFIRTLKVFPENLFAEATLSFSGRGAARGFEEILGSTFPVTADPRGLTLRVSYLLTVLPEASSYIPRRADSRVGFFQTAYRDWSRPDQRDQVVQSITRWNLVKKDPRASLSEPVKPIVFWVDSAFPPQYRKTVADAIASWNSAFEKIGFKNAVIVKQMTEKEDFDHADVRYNVVRLVASPSDAYAVANFRVNPLTGEILNAGITLDANFLRAIAGEWEMVGAPSDPVRHTGDDHASHCAACQLQKKAAANAVIGASAILLKEGPSAKERLAQFADEFLFSVIQHEMGHILGLRHNFVASTQLSMAELADPEKVKKHNTSASVMDYIPFNIQALGRPQVPFFGRGLGDYDYWAIRFGYSDTGIKDPDAEAKTLAALASQGSKWGLNYQTDEQAMSQLDPYAVQFDMASDPLQYHTAQAQLTHKLLMSLGTRKPLAGQSYNEFSRAFTGLLGAYANSVMSSSGYIGGVRRNFARRGDAGASLPFVPVSGADQRRALQAMTKGLLDEKVFDFPKHYYRMFQPSPKAGFTESLFSALNDYPMLDQIAGYQAMALETLLEPSRLSRLSNQEWMAMPGERPLTVREVFAGLGASVWSELKSGSTVSPLRRQLQRVYLDRLISIGVKEQGARSDVNLFAWAQLREIHALLTSAKPTDSTTQLHFADLKMRAARALNAVETLGGSAPRGGGLDLSSLLGGAAPAQVKAKLPAKSGKG